MERTESVVVQVAPNGEQEKIKEMAVFRWNLQNRQEFHEEGDVEGRPSMLAEFNNTYVITTKVHHYVKLHFVRSLNLKGYGEIKRIEDECRKQSFPKQASFKSYLFPIGLLALGVFSVFGAFPPDMESSSSTTVVFVIGGFWLAIKILLLKKRQVTRHASAKRCQTLIAKLPAFDEVASPAVEQAKDMKDCPLCGESIKASAVLCRFCNNKLPSPA